MSDGIYYNQEVTTDTLNEIAIDLGATSFNGFTTNKFGANELNQITAALVGKGVLLSGDMCRPVISDGLLYISSGTIVFENGAKKVLTEAVNVPLTASTCIYAFNDVAAGTCSIISAEAFPDAGDYVKLASVDESGNVIDARDIAMGKTAPAEGMFSEEISVTFTQGVPTYQTAVSYDDKYFEDPNYGVSYVPKNPMCQYFLISIVSGVLRSPYPAYVKLSSESQKIMIIPEASNLSDRLVVRKVGNVVQMYLGQEGTYPDTLTITGTLV